MAIIVDKSTRFVRIVGAYPHRWYMKPVCWIRGHKKVWTSAFGIRYRQCKRCGKDYYAKKIIKKVTALCRAGVIGELYGIRFIKTVKARIYKGGDKYAR